MPNKKDQMQAIITLEKFIIEWVVKGECGEIFHSCFYHREEGMGKIIHKTS